MPRNNALLCGLVLWPHCSEEDEAVHNLRDFLGQACEYEMMIKSDNAQEDCEGVCGSSGPRHDGESPIVKVPARAEKEILKIRLHV